jgi:hypothetical protein
VHAGVVFGQLPREIGRDARTILFKPHTRHTTHIRDTHTTHTTRKTRRTRHAKSTKLELLRRIELSGKRVRTRRARRWREESLLRTPMSALSVSSKLPDTSVWRSEGVKGHVFFSSFFERAVCACVRVRVCVPSVWRWVQRLSSERDLSVRLMHSASDTVRSVRRRVGLARRRLNCSSLRPSHPLKSSYLGYVGNVLPHTCKDK